MKQNEILLILLIVFIYIFITYGIKYICKKYINKRSRIKGNNKNMDN